MLNTILHGDDTGLPSLLIAHGLFGSARNWGVVAKRLSRTRQVVAVDMRNHGDSPHEKTNSYLDMADDLAEVTASGSDILGHSMGGKAVMAFALKHPERLRRIIVADIAPVAYDHSQQPMIDAMRKVDLSIVEKRSDADAQLARYIDESDVRAFLLQSLDVQARRWKLNLDVLENDMDQIIGFPDLDGRFDGPVLFLSGAESTYVTREHRPRIKALFPKARFAKIPGAGHWLHAEKPREFEATVAAFLDT